jgi:uncharacterized protein
MRPVLFIMAKAPVAGRTKTRLAADIGAVEALRFYRAMSFAVASKLGNDSRWETVIAVTPDASLWSPCWPDHLPRVPQGTGDLGDRMQRLLEMASGRRTIIVGTDIPDITPAHIARAFHDLGKKPAILGPAPDGGYWLVGARSTPRVPDFFANVRWSSPTTFADTLKNLGADNVALADELEDVDTVADYLRWKALAGRLLR